MIVVVRPRSRGDAVTVGRGRGGARASEPGVRFPARVPGDVPARVPDAGQRSDGRCPRCRRTPSRTDHAWSADGHGAGHRRSGDGHRAGHRWSGDGHGTGPRRSADGRIAGGGDRGRPGGADRLRHVRHAGRRGPVGPAADPAAGPASAPASGPLRPGRRLRSHAPTDGPPAAHRVRCRSARGVDLRRRRARPSGGVGLARARPPSAPTRRTGARAGSRGDPRRSARARHAVPRNL
jgi:hypothetical protein